MKYYLTDNPYFKKITIPSDKFIEIYRSPKRPPSRPDLTTGVDIWYHKVKRVYVVLFWDRMSEDPDIITVTTDIIPIFSRLDHTYLPQKRGYLYLQLLEQLHRAELPVSGNLK